MTKKTIKFSHDYPKFENDCFSTIRRRGTKWDLGDIITVISPKHKFDVRVTHKSKTKLKEMGEKFLLADTGKENRKDAIKLLNSFYKKPIKESELLTVLWLCKI